VTFRLFARRSRLRTQSSPPSPDSLSWLTSSPSPSPMPPTPSLGFPHVPPTAHIAPQLVVTVDVPDRLRLHGHQEALCYPPTERMTVVDPNATLTVALVAANRVLSAPDELPPDELHDLAMRMAESLDSLDQWIRRGGFLPSSWEKHS
jgi:hypothetical protein